MTPVQVHLVRSSFARIEAIKGQAALFYQRLFELDPNLRPLFRADMAAQGAEFMAALGVVVGAVDRLDILPLVRQLGRQHTAYGLQADHYAPAGEALI